MAAQIVAEFRALGAWFIVHGPEIWLAIVCAAFLCAGIVLGMWLASLLGANGKEDDE